MLFRNLPEVAQLESGRIGAMADFSALVGSNASWSCSDMFLCALGPPDHFHWLCGQCLVERPSARQALGSSGSNATRRGDHRKGLRPGSAVVAVSPKR